MRHFDHDDLKMTMTILCRFMTVFMTINNAGRIGVSAGKIGGFLIKIGLFYKIMTKNMVFRPAKIRSKWGIMTGVKAMR